MTQAIKRIEATALRDAVGGRVYVAGDDGYDAGRLPWQRKHHPHPAVVVEATGTPGNRLAAVRRVVRSLRTYTPSAPSRLEPPRVPRALARRLEPGPFRTALRSFGPYRYSSCAGAG